MNNGDLLWQSDNCELCLFKFGKLYTNTGVFINQSTKEAFLIDAPYGASQGLADLISRKFSIKALFITHSHWDHIGDDYLFQQLGAKVYIHCTGREIIENPEIIKPYTKCGFGLHPCHVERGLEDGDHMEIAGIDIQMSWVPGHSASGMSFYIAKAGVVFVGDTLFRDAIGRYDFVDGDQKQLIASIKEKILTLPGDTIVVPGHGDLTTVKYESENNPFF